MATEKSAGVILFTEDEGRRYLLLHYTDGHWDFIKGKIEKNEDEKKTIFREAKEEANLSNMSLYDGFRETIIYLYKKKEEVINKEVVFYLGTTDEKEIMVSDEHIGYVWLSYDKAMKKLTYPNARDVLQKAETFLKRYPTLGKKS